MWPVSVSQEQGLDRYNSALLLFLKLVTDIQFIEWTDGWFSLILLLGLLLLLLLSSLLLLLLFLSLLFYHNRDYFIIIILLVFAKLLSLEWLLLYDRYYRKMSTFFILRITIDLREQFFTRNFLLHFPIPLVCLSVSQCVCLSVCTCLFSVCVFLYVSVCLSVCVCLSIFLFIYLSLCVCVCLSVYWFVWASICLSIFLSVCLSWFLLWFEL